MSPSERMSTSAILPVIVMALAFCTQPQQAGAAPAVNTCPAQQYEYTITNSTGLDGTAGVNCLIGSPGSGWSLHDRECFWDTDSPTVKACHSDFCLWKKLSAQKFEYTMTHASSASTEVNCSSTHNPGGGYSLKKRTCVLTASNFCISDICLWERSAAIASTNVLIGNTHTRADLNVDCRTFQPSTSTPSPSPLTQSTENLIISVGKSTVQRFCVHSVASGNCVSDLCFWQEYLLCPNAQQCFDGTDNDGDQKKDSADPGCHSDGNPYNANSYQPTDADESSPGNTQCNDGIDNDGDLGSDMADPGCHIDGNPHNAVSYDAMNNNEASVVNTQCNDNIDNDSDTLSDYPFDGGCASPLDNNESVGSSASSAQSTSSSASSVSSSSSSFSPSSSSAGSSAAASSSSVASTLPCMIDAGWCNLQVNPGSGSGSDTGGTTANAGATNVSNNQNTQNVSIYNAGAHITVTSPTINVNTGAANVGVTATANPNTALSNTLATAQGSAGYPQYPYSPYTPYSSQNYAYGQYPQSANYPYPGSSYLSPYSLNQQSPAYSNMGQCSNGIDDDNDGLIDYPKDLGCQNPQDTNETNLFVPYYDARNRAQCNDGLDNDHDGRIDSRWDNGCRNERDNDESIR